MKYFGWSYFVKSIVYLIVGSSWYITYAIMLNFYYKIANLVSDDKLLAYFYHWSVKTLEYAYLTKVYSC
jgi:hypothetical protein